MHHDYEMLWRPTFEGYAAFAWAGGTLASVMIVMFAELPPGPFFYMGGIAVIMTFVRGQKALRHWITKRSLSGRDLTFLKAEKVLSLVNKDKTSIWLGNGFDWGQLHAQRVYEISKRSLDVVEDNRKAQKSMGAGWIHGVEPNEIELRVPLKHLEGHTLVFGTPGSGKTRLFDLLITQAVLRNEPVIIIDPKGDKDLRATAQRACIMAGRPEAFMHFHPAHPTMSVSIDPLANWNRSTELASRIASLIPKKADMDPFVAFSWMVLNNIVRGLLVIDEKPDLVKLKKHIKGDPESLLVKALRAHIGRHIPDWKEKSEEIMKKHKATRSVSNEISALKEFYETHLEETEPCDALDGLFSIYNHARDHFSKMITSLLPVLDMLTSTELRPLLSPRSCNHDKNKPDTDSATMINQNQVVYIGLDSLSDNIVGSAIGSIVLADMTAVAGDRYNYNVENTRVNIFIDEAAEVVNDPMIQMMNKGRGAGFQVTIATQSFPDFTARTGSKDKARQVLANTNNLIALRLKDGETQEYVTESFGQTIIRQVMHTQNTNAIAGDRDVTNWTGGYGERLIENEMPLFPADLLGQLPNMEFIASVSGGRIIKGRVPIINSNINPELEDTPWLKESL